MKSTRRPVLAAGAWRQLTLLCLALLLPLAATNAQKTNFSAMAERLSEAVRAGDVSEAQAGEMIAALARRVLAERLHRDRQKKDGRQGRGRRGDQTGGDRRKRAVQRRAQRMKAQGKARKNALKKRAQARKKRAGKRRPGRKNRGQSSKKRASRRGDGKQRQSGRDRKDRKRTPTPNKAMLKKIATYMQQNDFDTRQIEGSLKAITKLAYVMQKSPSDKVDEGFTKYLRELGLDDRQRRAVFAMARRVAASMREESDRASSPRRRRDSVRREVK